MCASASRLTRQPSCSADWIVENGPPRLSPMPGGLPFSSLGEQPSCGMRQASWHAVPGRLLLSPCCQPLLLPLALQCSLGIPACAATVPGNPCLCSRCNAGYWLSPDQAVCQPCAPLVDNCAVMNADPCNGCDTCLPKHLRSIDRHRCREVRRRCTCRWGALQQRKEPAVPALAPSAVPGPGISFARLHCGGGQHLPVNGMPVWILPQGRGMCSCEWPSAVAAGAAAVTLLLSLLDVTAAAPRTTTHPCSIK